MKKSLSFHLTMLVLKLKGIKKLFSKSPVDYKKVRKEDVHSPKGTFFGGENVRNFNIEQSTITEVKKGSADKLLIFVHGGGFISGPGQHHWDTVKQLYQKTECTVWMCNYPKAPEHDILQISKNIDLTYQKALAEYEPDQISLIGDSVGGNLISTLIQRLVMNGKKVPHKIILVSPVMDATFSNAEIARIEEKDPMLSKVGLLSAKKMCAKQMELSDPMISPINGSFEGFPVTLLYLAENDITYPDQQLAVQKMNDEGVDFKVIIGEEMPHIWPFLPVMKEAKISLNKIIEQLND